MKSINIYIALFLMSAGLSAFAEGTGTTKWSCSLNDQKSAIKLAQILNAHPKKRGGPDDAGLHMERDLIRMEISIKEGQVTEGKFYDSSGGNYTQPLDLAAMIQKPKDSNKDADSRFSVDTTKGMTLHFDSDGWDHYHYSLKLQPKLKQIELNYDEQQDCSDAYASLAIYDCTVVNE